MLGGSSSQDRNILLAQHHPADDNFFSNLLVEGKEDGLEDGDEDEDYTGTDSDSG